MQVNRGLVGLREPRGFYPDRLSSLAPCVLFYFCFCVHYSHVHVFIYRRIAQRHRDGARAPQRAAHRRCSSPLHAALHRRREQKGRLSSHLCVRAVYTRTRGREIKVKSICLYVSKFASVPRQLRGHHCELTDS